MIEWTGAISNEWSEVGNWVNETPGGGDDKVPNGSNKVVIRNGLTPYPVLDVDAGAVDLEWKVVQVLR